MKPPTFEGLQNGKKICVKIYCARYLAFGHTVRNT